MVFSEKILNKKGVECVRKQLLLLICFCGILFSFGCASTTPEVKTEEEWMDEKENAQKELVEGFLVRVTAKEQADQAIKLKVSVTNQTEQDATFIFLTENLYYFQIKTEDGDVLYDSIGKNKENNYVRELIVKQGEAISFEETWDGTINGIKIPNGTYEVIGGILVNKTENIEIDENGLFEMIHLEVTTH